MRWSVSAVLLAAAIAVPADAVDNEATGTTTSAPACTATSSSGSGAFFDLRPDQATHADPKGKAHKTAVAKDYHAKGHDYGKNFTMNICGSVVDAVSDVVGVQKSDWANVSAYYMSRGSIYSIGSESMDLRSRGRKLVLQYTGGSPCDSAKSAKNRRSAPSDQDHGLRARDDTASVRRKSTTISFLCDRDPSNSQASISFVGTDPDECAYFFEARSVHACAHAEPHKPGSVGPGSVFGIILLIAVLVYALGGVFYNRTVTNARGWRQLPNYSIWAGIWNLISETCIIIWDYATRCLPRRRGYSYLNSTASNRNRSSEAENRLIDQLDEEWDD
ncbi:hypothetical protein CDD82_2688 [Ophiocordyceps australis]|uniref:MRH domain-containing protein n=1 Tax=Ophiocordyceps australis TaxID=1399860 RepID=A0A2C5YYT9_9HYPO|nr:hypothetical protein CDD82_2688 [Ophiocordyceps australis]